jgi:cell division protein FtsB
MRRVRKQKVTQQRKMRSLVYLTLGSLIFLYISLSLVFGEKGVIKYMKLRSETGTLRAEVDAIRRQNEDLSSQIEKLQKNPDLIEELARDELGLTKEGEVIFEFEKGR